MNDREFAELHARAEAALTKIPGVFGVGYGLREVGGVTTDEIAFRVYVREKKAQREVPSGERIPAEFEGIPTDVLRMRVPKPLHCQDMEQHSPLIGGISITNFKGTGGNEPAGTLGFFATLDGVSPPENVVLVSNRHVLEEGGAVSGDTIFQPKFVEENGQVAILLDDKDRRPIAKIHKIGLEGNHPFAYPSEGELDYFVDCASAKLNISISSWCETNCGVSYRNEIRDLNIGGKSHIEDVARITQADLDAGTYTVIKVGRKTSRTEGNVTDIVLPLAGGGKRAIEIDAAQPDCDGIDRFADHGDSGSAVINLQNELVGLLFAIDNVDPSKAFACHIHPVLDCLSITAISTLNPPLGPAGKALSNVEGIVGDGPDETIVLRERLLATPRGAEIYDLLLEHRAEVVTLVNRHRPVTVAWHRGQGPAFLAHAVENARHPAHPIPFEIEGVGRRALLERMAEVLAEHGGEGLRRAIETHAAEVLALIDQFDDLHELVGRFEESPVHA